MFLQNLCDFSCLTGYKNILQSRSFTVLPYASKPAHHKFKIPFGVRKIVATLWGGGAGGNTGGGGGGGGAQAQGQFCVEPNQELDIQVGNAGSINQNGGKSVVSMRSTKNPYLVAGGGQTGRPDGSGGKGGMAYSSENFECEPLFLSGQDGASVFSFVGGMGGGGANGGSGGVPGWQCLTNTGDVRTGFGTPGGNPGGGGAGLCFVPPIVGVPPTNGAPGLVVLEFVK